MPRTWSQLVRWQFHRLISSSSHSYVRHAWRLHSDRLAAFYHYGYPCRASRVIVRAFHSDDPRVLFLRKTPTRTYIFTTGDCEKKKRTYWLAGWPASMSTAVM